MHFRNFDPTRPEYRPAGRPDPCPSLNCNFPLAVNSNVGRISYRFRDIDA